MIEFAGVSDRGLGGGGDGGPLLLKLYGHFLGLKTGALGFSFIFQKITNISRIENYGS